MLTCIVQSFLMQPQVTTEACLTVAYIDQAKFYPPGLLKLLTWTELVTAQGSKKVSQQVSRPKYYHLPPFAQSLPIAPAASISSLLPILCCAIACLPGTIAGMPPHSHLAACADVAEVPVSAQAACWGEELAANRSTPIWCQQPARCHHLLPSSLIWEADPVRLERDMGEWAGCLLVCRILHVWPTRCVAPTPTPSLTLGPASCLICPTTLSMQITISEGLSPIL